MIQWHEVVTIFSPTHILIIMIGGLITHVSFAVVKWCGKIGKGMVLSDTRRALSYVHYKNGHNGPFKLCRVGYCPRREDY